MRLSFLDKNGASLLLKEVIPFLLQKIIYLGNLEMTEKRFNKEWKKSDSPENIQQRLLFCFNKTGTV